MKPALHPPLPEVHLKSGLLLVTNKPQWIITVLGSCVAVTLFNPRTGLAAVCHAMLPRPRRDAPMPPPRSERHRYVSHVVPDMANHFLEQGVALDEIEVKLFGGANVLQGGKGQSHDRMVGSSNVIAAREFLAAARLTVRAENVGGFCGRKILFNTQSGEVLHKHLSNLHDRP